MRSTHQGRAISLLRSERGITGLETAIILIAFIVVASVFAYTVLTAGVLSSQKSNEAVNAAIEEVRSSITITGNTIAYKGSVDIDGDTTTSDGTDAVVKIDITVAVALQGVPVDVTPSFQLNSVNSSLEASGATKTLVVNLLDQRQLIQDMAWTVAFSGANDGDFSLEATEKAIITVWLVEYDYDNAVGLYYNLGAGASDTFFDIESDLLGNFDPFTMEISPVQDAQLTIEKVVPQSLNAIMNLR
jgi:flagellin FlaB